MGEEGSGREKKYWFILQNYHVVSDNFSLTRQLLVFPNVNMARLISASSLNRAEHGGVCRTGCCGREERGCATEALALLAELLQEGGLSKKLQIFCYMSLKY